MAAAPVAAVAAVAATATADRGNRGFRLHWQARLWLLIILLLQPAAESKAHAAEPDAGFCRITFPGHDAALSAEIADTEPARQRGLSGRPELAADRAMLFVLDHERVQGIWMKGMQVPLDILWFSSDFRLVGKAANVGPDSYPEIFRPEQPAKYILEVNAGFLERHPLEPDERMVIDAACRNVEQDPAVAQ